MPLVLRKTLISQILEAGLDDISFSEGSTLLQYADDVLLCSFSQISSQEDSIHLLELLALQGPKVSIKKITICPNSGSVFGI